MNDNKKIKAKFILNRRINAYTLLLESIIFVFLGVYILFWAKSITLIPFIVSVALLFRSLHALLLVFTRKSFIRNIFECVINALMGIIFYLNPSYLRSIFGIALGLYLLLLAFISILSAYFYKRNSSPGTARNIFVAIMQIVIAILSILNPSVILLRLRIIVGIYLLIFAVTSFIDFLIQIIPQSTKSRVRRRMRVTLPNIFSAFIPVGIYKELKKSNLLGKNIVEGDVDNVDIEVFIHASEVFPGQMGHLDFCIGGRVLSYGNYDESSYYLWGLAGDGVLEVIDKEAYLQFCISYSKKIIISFGLKLDEEQKKRVESKVLEIMEDTELWEPEAARKKSHSLRSSKEMSDYASELYKATNAKFYKFTSSIYKTYFTFNRNCVKLGDEVLGVLGIDELASFGLITPGKYYSYFDREFRKNNSFVKVRRIYAANSDLV